MKMSEEILKDFVLDREIFQEGKKSNDRRKQMGKTNFKTYNQI